MEYLKRIEGELTTEWRHLQLEKVPEIKAAALKAYYLKFRLYQLQRERNLLLFG